MMRGLLLLAATLAAPAAAQTATPQTQAASVDAVTPAKRAKALRFIQLFMPIDLLVKTEVEQFDKHFGPSIRLNADVAAMEATAPGAIDAMARAARPLIGELQGEFVRSMHRAYVDMLSARMSSADLDELANLYTDPAAASILAKFAASVDTSKTYERASTDANATFGEAEISRNMATGTAGMAAKSSPAERAFLAKITARPAFQRFTALEASFKSTMLQELNKERPDMDKRIEAAMRTALQAHLAKAKAGSGK